jgi:tetratricopeptide (TPR) repeat protein
VEIIRGQLDTATGDLVQAAQAADRGHDDRTRARALIYLANLEVAFRERPDQARELLDLAAAAADRAGDDQLRASALIYSGRLAGRLGETAEQVADAERALALSPTFVGNELYDTERAVGDAYAAAGRLDDAEAAFHRVIDRLRASYGTDDHPDIAAALGGLGTVAYARGAYHSALDLARQEVAIYERMGEATQYNHIPARESLAVAEIAAGDPASAVLELAVLSTDCDNELGRLNSQCRSIRYNLGGALGTAHQDDPAIEVYREALVRTDAVDPHSPDVVDIHRNIGVLLERQGKYRDAVAEYRRALAARIAIDGRDATDAAAALRADLARAEAGGR